MKAQANDYALCSSRQQHLHVKKSDLKHGNQNQYLYVQKYWKAEPLIS